MSAELWITGGAILICILLSFLFSGSETALTAVSRARLQSLETSGSHRAATISRLISHRDRLIGALLIGNNIVNILASALATSAFLEIFGAAGIAYATVTMTVLLVVFSEVLPKSWAIAAPERFALAVAPWIRAYLAVVGPASMLVTSFVRTILRLFGIHSGHGTPLLTGHGELRGTVEVLHREGGVVKGDRDRVGGVLDLYELDLYDVMIHRTNMRMINGDEPAENIVAEVIASPNTRLPVWRGSTDNIVGILHARDVLRALSAAGGDARKVRTEALMRKPWFVPDTTSLEVQLAAFLKQKAHIAIVVDEYGEVQGLVTLEDILEEIVGEIADEHDIDIAGVRQEADGSVVVDGSVPIRDLNRALDWKLPDDAVTTIAGLVIHEAQTIPEEKQAFTFHGMRFLVLERDKNRIVKLRIRPAAVTDRLDHQRTGSPGAAGSSARA